MQYVIVITVVYILFYRDISQWMKQGNFLRNERDKSITAHDRDGKLKNLLKKTYLGRWVGRLDPDGDQSGVAANNNESSPMNKRPNYSVVLARSVLVFLMLAKSTRCTTILGKMYFSTFQSLLFKILIVCCLCCSLAN